MCLCLAAWLAYVTSWLAASTIAHASSSPRQVLPLSDGMLHQLLKSSLALEIDATGAHNCSVAAFVHLQLKDGSGDSAAETSVSNHLTRRLSQLSCIRLAGHRNDNQASGLLATPLAPTAEYADRVLRLLRCNKWRQRAEMAMGPPGECIDSSPAQRLPGVQTRASPSGAPATTLWLLLQPP